MSPRDLDRRLHELSTAVEWPPTPDLAAGIGDRLPARTPAATVERPAHPRIGTGAGRSRVLRRPVAVAALMTCVVLVAVGGAVQPVRAKIEHLLGIAGGERVERTQHVKPAARLDLGRPVSLAEARQLANFTIRVPHLRTGPSSVRLGGDLGGGAVSLLYGTNTVLTEFPDTAIYPGVKQVGPGVAVRFFDINHSQGIWIAAGPRALRLQGADGRVHTRAAALPGSGVLLWQRGRVALRLETRRGLSAALALARSVR